MRTDLRVTQHPALARRMRLNLVRAHIPIGAHAAASSTGSGLCLTSFHHRVRLGLWLYLKAVNISSQTKWKLVYSTHFREG